MTAGGKWAASARYWRSGWGKRKGFDDVVGERCWIDADKKNNHNERLRQT
jgi:hypothetical protein